jgi:hypothetical protein
MSDVVEDARASELLFALRAELGEELCGGVDDRYLWMFLRWKPSVERAAARYRVFLKWKRENPALFDQSLRITKDPELERLLLKEIIVGPPGLLTKGGGPLLIGRFRNMDFTDGRTTTIDVCRMIFYTLDRTLNRRETQDYGVTILHDLRDFDIAKNVRIEVPKTVFRGLFGHFPLRVNGIYLWKAPAFFRPFFRIVSHLLMPKKVRERVHFIDDLSEVESIIDTDSLLTELGGKLVWSSYDWVEENKQEELSGTMKSLTDIDP